MGDVGDFFVGKTEDPTVQQLSTLTGGQGALLKQLTDLLRDQVGTGVQAYPGSLTAGSSDLQKKSWELIEQLLSGRIQDRSATSQEAINRILWGDRGRAKIRCR